MSRPSGVKKGIALLMTLVILLMISISLTEVFEDGSVELKLMERDERDQDADRLIRSITKGLIAALRKEGANHLYTLTEKLGDFGSVIPVSPEIPWMIANPRVKSMDHFLNVNFAVGKTETSDEFQSGYQYLLNILTLPFAEKALVDEYQVAALADSLVDLTDKDDVEVPRPMGGEEGDYATANPAFSVNNVPLFSVSEMRVLPAYQNLYGDPVVKSLPLKTEDNAGPCLSYNLNMLPVGNAPAVRKKLLVFLDLLENMEHSTCRYDLFYANREELAEIIGEARGSLLNSVTFDNNLSALDIWDPILVGDLSRGLIGTLFKHRSDQVEISFGLADQTGKIWKNVQMHLKLSYQNTQAVKSNDIKIVYYKITSM